MAQHEVDEASIGSTVVDIRGERIGELTALIDDDQSASVLFGTVLVKRHGRRRLVLVSLDGAVASGSRVNVKCGKNLVRTAPSVEPGELLPLDEERSLYAHYDLPFRSTDPPRRRLSRRS